ncbi:MAG: GAF domain-containing protein [Nitrospirota bacterium]|nr:GAF domain-containing protein [Nitrospirota bacterium]
MKKLSDAAAGNVTTLRQKIFLMTVPVLILTSVVYMLEAVRTERKIMREEILKKAEVVTMLATYSGELPLISENPELLKREIMSLKSVQEVSFVVFYDRDMKLLIREGNVLDTSLRYNRDSSLSIIEEDDHFDLSAPVFTVRAGKDIDIFEETSSGKAVRENIGWVRIGFSKDAIKQAERNFIYRGLMIALVLIIISSILVYRLAAAATRPLDLLLKAVKSVRKGTYPEITITSGDETGTLSAEFNRMSRTIREREETLVSQAQLSALVGDIGIVLTESGTLQDILRRCAEIMLMRLDAVLTRIWTCDREKNMLELAARAGKYPHEQDPYTLIHIGQFEPGATAMSRRPHYGNDIERLHNDDREWARQKGIVSFACYPLIVEEQLVGMIEIYTDRILSEHIFNSMNTIADEIALGIQHKIVEQQIKSSLNEKEVLLREIHHRVKNNMQVITSLLSLQSEYIQEKRYVDMLNDSKNRIKSMAIIHEKLYKSKDMSNIDFRDYVTTLANNLFSFYEAASRNVLLNIRVEDVSLGIDTAIPCGLIINELLSNCLKHAFPEGRKGEIDLTLVPADIERRSGYDLIVSDNGVGLPEGLDIRNTKSLGLQLVMTLAEHQLQGKLDLDRSGGTSFHLHFNEVNYTKRT